jgi:hypothetical protein
MVHPPCVKQSYNLLSAKACSSHMFYVRYTNVRLMSRFPRCLDASARVAPARFELVHLQGQISASACVTAKFIHICELYQGISLPHSNERAPLHSLHTAAPVPCLACVRSIRVNSILQVTRLCQLLSEA